MIKTQYFRMKIDIISKFSHGNCLNFIVFAWKYNQFSHENQSENFIVFAWNLIKTQNFRRKIDKNSKLLHENWLKFKIFALKLIKAQKISQRPASWAAERYPCFWNSAPPISKTWLRYCPLVLPINPPLVFCVARKWW